MKLGEGAQRARACAHKGKRRSAKRRRRRKEEEQGGEGWGELGNRAGVRAPGPAPGSASRPGSHARAAVGRISRPGSMCTAHGAPAAIYM